jgi:F0F1-type ATP synthase membrane subunit b/b'
LRQFGSLQQAESEANTRLQALRSEESELRSRIAEAHQEHGQAKDAADAMLKNAKVEAAKILDEARSKAKAEAAKIVADVQAEVQSSRDVVLGLLAEAEAATQRLEATRAAHAEIEQKLASARDSVKKLLGEHS